MPDGHDGGTYQPGEVDVDEDCQQPIFEEAKWCGGSDLLHEGEAGDDDAMSGLK